MNRAGHTDSGSGPVLASLAREGGLAVLTLARPDKLNALNIAMRRQIGACLGDVAADPAMRVLLIRGEGRAFCAGADIADAPREPLAWRNRILEAQSQHLAIMRMPKIVIAAVQGVAAGGGASLALSADILILAQDARLSFPFVRLGVVPDGGAAYLLQAKLGVPAALDLLLSGGSLGAAEAERSGLTRRVVPAERLEDTARSLAAELLALPHEALVLTKSLCRHYWSATLDAALAHEADAFALATATEGHKRAFKAAREAHDAGGKG